MRGRAAAAPGRVIVAVTMSTVPAGRGLPRNRSGVHFLSSRRVAAALVRSAGVGPGDLVVDVGAGQGAVTAPLAATGATVLAVERDESFAQRLQRRFAGDPAVRVIHGDLRSVPLPHRRFQVVASVPFAVTTPLLRRLLDPPGTRMDAADLIVEWGLARRLTRARPRDLETAWWSARFTVRVAGRVPAGCFTPAPRVDAAHLVVRGCPGVDGRAARVLWTLLHAAYTVPGQPSWAVPGGLVGRGRARQLLAGAGLDPQAPAGTVEVAHWSRLAVPLAVEPAVPIPALPRRLRQR